VRASSSLRGASFWWVRSSISSPTSLTVILVRGELRSRPEDYGA
jgi:hypothetical protein